MKNTVILSGRLPGFEGKYTPAAGDKKSRMNWAMNVQLSSKNDQGYNDEALINFTAWGWFADQLEQANQMDKETRKEYTAITVTGRINAGYKKDDNIVNQVSLDVSEFEFIKRLPQANTGTTAGERTFTPAGAPAGRGAQAPGKSPMGAPAGRGPGAPMTPPLNRPVGGPRF